MFSHCLPLKTASCAFFSLIFFLVTKTLKNEFIFRVLRIPFFKVKTGLELNITQCIIQF